MLLDPSTNLDPDLKQKGKIKLSKGENHIVIKSYHFLGGFLDFLQIGGHEAPAQMELQGQKKRGEGDFVGMG